MLYVYHVYVHIVRIHLHYIYISTIYIMYIIVLSCPLGKLKSPVNASKKHPLLPHGFCESDRLKGNTSNEISIIQHHFRQDTSFPPLRVQTLPALLLTRRRWQLKSKKPGLPRVKRSHDMKPGHQIHTPSLGGTIHKALVHVKSNV